MFHAMKTVSVMFPLMVVQLATGMIFGKFTAIVLNLVGTALCMVIGYGLGVYAGTSIVGKLVDKSPRLARLLECQNQNTLFFCFFLRSIFITPMDVVSMYFGATRASFGKYMLGSMLGMLPCVVLTTIMGQNILDPTSPEFIGSFAIILLLSLCSLIWYAIVKKKKGL
jgi:uncharacterized membrane protein YdjX (TVP38/TMEM64 family)